MDAISRTRHRGPTIAVLAGLVIGALLAPVTAFAVEDDDAVILPEPIEFPEDATIEDTQGEQPDPATPVAASCDDLLAVVSPEGTEGDGLAVAITAQSIDADIAGWSNVAWEPASGTTLREVIVTGTDGTLTSLTDGTDHATDVATLTFCGTLDRPANKGPKPSAPATPAPTTSAPTTPGPSTEVPTPTDIAPTTSLAPTTGSSTGTATTGTDRDAPSSADPADRTEPDAPGVTGVEPLEAPDEANEANNDTRADVTDDAEPVEEVEVLGVQLAREDAAGGDGRFGGWVAMLAGIALLATAGGVMWSRHS